MKLAIHSFLHHGNNKHLSFADVWKNVAKLNGLRDFPHMLQFVYAMCCIPAHTCDVERGFSAHRLIKHRLTSCLKVVTVDSLMRVKLNSGATLDSLEVSARNNSCTSLAQVVTPMLKPFFEEVNYCYYLV